MIGGEHLCVCMSFEVECGADELTHALLGVPGEQLRRQRRHGAQGGQQ
jgi:hypothetical protein